MTRLLFEDNEASPLSQVLINAYEGKYLFKFVNGNQMLGPELKRELKSIGKTVDACVYVDVVPDNVNTLGVLKRIIKLVKNENLQSVKVVPIPCIEYCLLKTVYGRRGIEYQPEESTRDCSRYKEYCNKMTSKDSLEVYCKFLVSGLLESCLKSPMQSIFFLKDCKYDEKWDATQKVEYFVKQLKVFPHKDFKYINTMPIPESPLIIPEVAAKHLLQIYDACARVGRVEYPREELEWCCNQKVEVLD